MKNQKRFYTSAKGDVLGFYVSFVKMQLCVAKMQLCSDFYTSIVKQVYVTVCIHRE